MDPMGNLRKNRDDSSSRDMVIETPRVPPLFPSSASTLPGSATTQFHPAAAFFPPNAACAVATVAAFAGNPPSHRYFGNPATAGDILLPGNYPRVLESATSYQHIQCPYNMAIAKGNSFEGEGSVSKKPRTVFTPKQLLHLEEEFSTNQFPNLEQRKKIATALDLTQQHIQIWFQNRRAKKRRKKKRQTEEEKMRKDPKPPPFWPSNLPFSSNLGDIAKKSKSSSGNSKKDEATDTVENGSESCSSSPPMSNATEQSPSGVVEESPHSSQQQENKHSPSVTAKCPNTEHTGSSTSRPSHLTCSPPLESPTTACALNNGHTQLPTPPPYISPNPSSHPSLDPVAHVEHTITSEVVLTPPGDLASMHTYPPLPPPESLLVGSFDDIGSFPQSLAPPFYDSLLSTRTPRGIVPPPPPYSFNSSHMSSRITLSSQLSYTTESHSVAFYGHRNFASNSSAAKPLAITSEANPGQSSLSPTTLSPLTNSDSSSSPLTQDVALPAPQSTLPSEGNFPSLSSRPVPNVPPPSHVPIHATDPIALTDVQEEWDFFTRAACPVIQTGHEMWTAAPSQQSRAKPSNHTKHLRRKSSSPSSNAIQTEGTSSSISQVYSEACGVGYFPPFGSDSAVTRFSTATNVSSGAD